MTNKVFEYRYFPSEFQNISELIKIIESAVSQGWRFVSIDRGNLLFKRKIQ